ADANHLGHAPRRPVREGLGRWLESSSKDLCLDPGIEPVRSAATGEISQCRQAAFGYALLPASYEAGRDALGSCNLGVGLLVGERQDHTCAPGNTGRERGGAEHAEEDRPIGIREHEVHRSGEHASAYSKMDTTNTSFAVHSQVIYRPTTIRSRTTAGLQGRSSGTLLDWFLSSVTSWRRSSEEAGNPHL